MARKADFEQGGPAEQAARDDVRPAPPGPGVWLWGDGAWWLWDDEGGQSAAPDKE